MSNNLTTETHMICYPETEGVGQLYEFIQSEIDIRVEAAAPVLETLAQPFVDVA